jgi:hypothetical protein
MNITTNIQIFISVTYQSERVNIKMDFEEIGCKNVKWLRIGL